MIEPVVFTTSGTVQAQDGIYLTRQADEDMFQLCRRGEYAYILTSRQMGKSSLMVATAERLQMEDGIQTAIIDLQRLGAQTTTADKWYFGLLTELARKLRLLPQLMTWWEANTSLGEAQRLVQFLEDVLLPQIVERLVVFIDEIDSTLSLDFTDDFFIALRYCFTARAENPDFEKLSFVLIGVATPSELIADEKRTPFNIGKLVELKDFNESEAQPLAAGLGLPESEAQQVLMWILNWTKGHPYLTQRVCEAVVQQSRSDWSAGAVDDLISELFFGEQRERDNNLQFVQNMLTRRAPDTSQVLNTYKDVLLKKRLISDKELSIINSHLKLSGVVVGINGFLKPKNLIYEKVFDVHWINANLPKDWIKKIRLAASFSGITFLVLLVPVSIFAELQRREAVQQRQIAEEQRQIAEEQRQIAEGERETIEKLLLGGSSRVQIQNVDPKVKAFLDMIAWSLGTLTENGYQVFANGTEFVSFSEHPRKRVCGPFYGSRGIIVDNTEELCVDAAGRYHIIYPTWVNVSRRLHLSNFSPESQDAAAIELLIERDVLTDLESGNFESAVHKSSSAWTTLPTKTGKTIYDRKIHSIEQLKIVYDIFLTRYL